LTFAALQHIIIAGGEIVDEKTITIRVPDDLHKQIKMEATKMGITIKDYLLALVEKDLKREKK